MQLIGNFFVCFFKAGSVMVRIVDSCKGIICFDKPLFALLSTVLHCLFVNKPLSHYRKDKLHSNHAYKLDLK